MKTNVRAIPKDPIVSQREVERKYNKMMSNDLYKAKAPKNRVNCYSCFCGHITKTIDIHNGVTPMFFDCEKCSTSANSSFYNDIAVDQEPTFEWYRPTLKQIMKMRSKPHVLDHILNGGLEYRKIKK